MKKLLFLISLLALLTFTGISQTVNYAMPQGATYMITSTTYNATNTTVRNFIYYAPTEFAATQNYLIHIDSVSGNHTNVAVALFGAKFGTSAYSAIGSAVNWKGTTTSDTTIVISNATANRYRYYKITVTGTGTGVSKIFSQEFKLYNQ